MDPGPTTTLQPRESTRAALPTKDPNQYPQVNPGKEPSSGTTRSEEKVIETGLCETTGRALIQGRYSRLERTSRQSMESVDKGNAGSNARMLKTTNLLTKGFRREFRAADQISRRSNEDASSNVRYASHKSERSSASRSTPEASRRIDTVDSYATSSYRRNERISRMRDSFTRTASTVGSQKIIEREIRANRQSNSQIQSQLSSRRAIETSQSSRRKPELRSSRGIRDLKQRNTDKRDISRTSEALEREYRLQSAERYNERRVQHSRGMEPGYEITGTKSRSIFGTSSVNNDASRRSAWGLNRSHRLQRVKRSSSPDYIRGERESAFRNSESMTVDRIASARISERGLPQMRRLTTPSQSQQLSRRTRDSNLESRRHTGLSRSTEMRAVSDRYSDQRDSSRMTDRLTTETKFRSASRLDERVGRRLGENYLDNAQRTRRSTSPQSIRSDIRDASRRSGLYLTESRRMERLERSVSPSYRRDNRESRIRVSVSRTAERLASLRISERDFPENQRSRISSQSHLLSRRLLDTSRDTRRNVDYTRSGDDRIGMRRLTEIRDDFRRSEVRLADRRAQSTPRLSEMSDRQLGERRARYTDGETMTRRTRSLSAIRSNNGDTSLSSERYSTISRRIGRMARSISPVYRSNERESTITASASRKGARIGTLRISERDLPGNVRLSTRSSPQLLSRRVRDISLDSRRNIKNSRTQDSRTDFQRYSTNRDNIRFSDEVVTERMVQSTSRLEDMPERRHRNGSPKNTATERMPRSTRSQVQGSSINSDMSRQYEHYPTAPRRIKQMERYEIPVYRQNERDSRFRVSVAWAVDRLAPGRMSERDLLYTQRWSIPTQAYLLSRRTRDSNLESRRHTDLSRSTEIRAVPDRYSDQRDSSRMTDRLTTETKFRRASRLDERVGRRLGENYLDNAQRTRRSTSPQGIRSDIRDASRRSGLYLTESRRMERLERSVSPSYRRDNRESRIRVSVSRTAERLASLRISERDFPENRRLNINLERHRLSRRIPDASRDAKRNTDHSSSRDVRAGMERSRRSEVLMSERRTQSTSRQSEMSEMRLAARSTAYTNVETLKRRTRSLFEFRLYNGEPSRRNERYSIDERMMEGLEPSVSPGHGRGVRNSRTNNAASRNMDKAISSQLSERNLVEHRRLSARSHPNSLSRRTRDSNLESRRHTGLSRSTEMRAVSDRYSDQRDSSRMTDRLTTETKFRSASRLDERVGRRLGENYLDNAQRTRRSTSPQSIRSDIRDASRRSGLYLTESRRMERLERSVSPSYRRDNRESRIRVSVSRTAERLASLRISERDFPENQRSRISSQSHLLSRRLLDTSRDTRRNVDYTRSGDDRIGMRRLTEIRDDFRRSEVRLADRRAQSTPRLSEMSDRQLGERRARYTDGETMTRRTRSLSAIRSNSLDLSRRTKRYLPNSQMMDRMEQSDSTNYRRELRVSRLMVSPSSNIDRQASASGLERKGIENRRMSARSQTHKLSRRTRDSYQESRKHTELRNINELRMVVESYSNELGSLRVLERLATKWAIGSTSRSDEIRSQIHSNDRGNSRLSRTSTSRRNLRSVTRLDRTNGQQMRIEKDHVFTERGARNMRALSEGRSISHYISVRSRRDLVDSRNNGKMNRNNIYNFKPVQRYSRNVASVSRVGSVGTQKESDESELSANRRWSLPMSPSFSVRQARHSGRNSWELPGATSRKVNVSGRERVSIHRDISRRLERSTSGRNAPSSSRSNEIRRRETREEIRERRAVLTTERRTISPAVAGFGLRELNPFSERNTFGSLLSGSKSLRAEESDRCNLDLLDKSVSIAFSPGPERLFCSNLHHISMPRQSIFRVETAVPELWELEIQTSYITSGHKVNQENTLTAKNSTDLQEATASFADSQCPTLVSPGSLRNSNEFTIGKGKGFPAVAKNMTSHISEIRLAPDDTLNTNALPDWKTIAIIFSKGFTLPENKFDSFLMRTLATESSAKAAFVPWASFTPDVYSNEQEVIVGVATPNAVAYMDHQGITGKHNEYAYGGLPKGASDEILIEMLHPKLVNKNKFFSMAIGGCVAALAISVSTK
ncbi:trichohyalin-like [Hetaerina americana]|uniref:trichohyalin-like n=1 Tax=Hetaerina americana TaxID=62018 RepID=UPI003A7F14BF